MHLHLKLLRHFPWTVFQSGNAPTPPTSENVVDYTGNLVVTYTGDFVVALTPD